MSNVHYTASEERLNVLTHALGFILSLIGSIFLLARSEGTLQLVSSIVFGISLLILYAASTLYHASKNQEQRKKLRIFDHAAIYVLIAGTYTPICIITLNESVGSYLLIAIWSVAAIGVTLKLFFTGRFDRISTAMYIAMGWLAIFAIEPLLESMSNIALIWLLAGGACYTVGAILYSIRSIPMNHATFHVFVLAGSGCHYLMIYLHVIG